MFLTIASARLPCCTILSRLPRNVSVISPISARSLPSRYAPRSASCSSEVSSAEIAEKLLTKLSGFLISWAIPAVSWPSDAIFSAWIRLAWAALRSRSAVSAASRALRISASARRRSRSRWSRSIRLSRNMPRVLVIAPISWALARGIWTSSSPRVIAAMLPSSLFSGTVIERTIRAVRPRATASVTIPPVIERLTTRSASRADASRPARACCSTLATIVSISSSILTMRLRACASRALPSALSSPE